jgi:hypothetical protein
MSLTSVYAESRSRETVFLDERNNLKLGDFGLSKAMQQAAMTQTYVGVSTRFRDPILQKRC